MPLINVAQTSVRSRLVFLFLGGLLKFLKCRAYGDFDSPCLIVSCFIHHPYGACGLVFTCQVLNLCKDVLALYRHRALKNHINNFKISLLQHVVRLGHFICDLHYITLRKCVYKVSCPYSIMTAFAEMLMPYRRIITMLAASIFSLVLGMLLGFVYKPVWLNR